MNDPCDAIESLQQLHKWCEPAAYGVLSCMWTGTIPAIARAEEPWRNGLDYLTPTEKNRRVVDYDWRTR